MVALPREAEQRRAQTLQHIRALRDHGDPVVQRVAEEVERDLEAVPRGLDEYLNTMAPEGLEVSRFEMSVGIVPAAYGEDSRWYAFRRPFRLLVVRDGEYFLAYSPTFLVHATGDTVEEALQAYFREWTHHYENLRQLRTEQRLGEPLKRELARIMRWLKQPNALTWAELASSAA